MYASGVVTLFFAAMAAATPVPAQDLDPRQAQTVNLLASSLGNCQRNGVTPINSGPININQCFNFSAPAFSVNVNITPSGFSACRVQIFSGKGCVGGSFQLAVSPRDQCLSAPASAAKKTVESIRVTCPA